MQLFSALKLLIHYCLLISLSGTAQAIASEGFIPVPGGSAWYKIVGAGSAIPLLLIHGGPGGGSCGLAPLTQLASNRPVIFYDQLGAGKSEQPHDLSLWTIDRFVAELSAVRKALHLPKVHLLAHSWGAAIAAQYLLSKDSEGIASVIFVGPYLSTEDWVKSTNTLRRQLSPSTQALLRKHELAETTESNEYRLASDEFYKLFLYRKTYSDPPECKDSAWNPTIYQTMWGTSEFFATGNLKYFNVAKDLARIKIPTLFIVGEYDELQEMYVHRYQQQMHDASVAVIKDAAHMSMVDQPELFMQTVTRFLQRTEAVRH